MNFASLAELDGLLRPLGQDESVSVVVITGGLPGYFVAHADLDDLARLGHGVAGDGDPRAWFRTLSLLEELPQPVVAAINGQCWGGGCELALACTLRLAARSATLALPEVGTAIIPGAGGTQRLPRLIGVGRALDLILTGRVIDADDALSLGLVTEVLEQADFEEAAVEWALKLAQRPRAALAAAKRAIIEGSRSAFGDGLRLEGRLVAERLRDPATATVVNELRERYRRSAPGTPIVF